MDMYVISLQLAVQNTVARCTCRSQHIRAGKVHIDGKGRLQLAQHYSRLLIHIFCERVVVSVMDATVVRIGARTSLGIPLHSG